MAIYFFETAAGFRAWLEKNHQTETELLVGFYKVGSKKASMTWSESVDEALCFGWIDGVRKSIDTDSYQIRFTPRKPTSIWSAVNIEKVEILTKSGRMQAAGLASFAHRVEQKSKIYTYEKDEIILASQYEAELKSNSKAGPPRTAGPFGSFGLPPKPTAILPLPANTSFSNSSPIETACSGFPQIDKVFSAPFTFTLCIPRAIKR